jgi:hypothetical protein
MIYTEHKDYKLIKLGIIYKSNQDQAWLCLDRESLMQRGASTLYLEEDREDVCN